MCVGLVKGCRRYAETNYASKAKTPLRKLNQLVNQMLTQSTCKAESYRRLAHPNQRRAAIDMSRAMTIQNENSLFF